MVTPALRHMHADSDQLDEVERRFRAIGTFIRGLLPGVSQCGERLVCRARIRKLHVSIIGIGCTDISRYAYPYICL